MLTEEEKAGSPGYNIDSMPKQVENGLNPIKAWVALARWREKIDLAKEKIQARVIAECAPYGGKPFAFGSSVIHCVNDKKKYNYSRDPEWRRLKELMFQREKLLRENMKEKGESLENEGAKAYFVYSPPNVVVSRSTWKLKDARRLGRVWNEASQ